MMGVLQSIGAYLVSEADPSTLLSAQVDQDPGTRLDDPPQRFIELGTAITAQGTQGLASYALRMNSHERCAYLAEPKTHQSEVFVTVRSGKRMSPEQPVLGRQSTGRDAMHAHALLRH
jgi:hypothetical protein